MKFSRTPPAINAGSMADIAFLLLLFFLVSTTISQERGIVRKLPSACKTKDCTTNVAERNILRIHINEVGELMVATTVIPVSELKEMVKDFIDNNGRQQCDYCEGAQLVTASDHPSEAVISLSSHRLSPYERFISVQDELTKAYKELRIRYAKTTFKKTLKNLTDNEIIIVQKAYPFIVSEASIAK